MDHRQLIHSFPRLYHVAHRDSWGSICRYGLLSTSALLDLLEVRDTERNNLESRRRPDSVTINHPKYGTVVIRDQKPIDEEKLRSCLKGMTPQEWYCLLNSMVFFWATEKRLYWFLGAKAYRHDPHCVITVDTRRLVEEYHARIRLSAINSGSTLSDPLPVRGRNTFKSIEQHSSSSLAEVAVCGGVRNIREVAIKAEIRKSNEARPRSILWNTEANAINSKR